MYRTYQEICGQYDAVQKTAEYMNGRKAEILDFFRDKTTRSFLFIGSGSSYCLSRSGELTAEMKLGKKASSLPAGDLMLHCRDYQKLLENSVLVAISRSGMTSEILSSISEARKRADVPVVAVCCSQNSKLSETADFALEIPWAFDSSVCQTRSVSNLYAALILLLSFLSDDPEAAAEIETVGQIGSEFLKANEPSLKTAAQKPWNNVIVLADGEMEGLASEAALAFKEISNVHSNYYHVLDVRHGPIVLANRRTLFLAYLAESGIGYEKQLVKDAAKTGGMVVALTNGNVEGLEGAALQISIGKPLGMQASGLFFLCLAQLLAYYKALQMGFNPDAPHDLDAWIKL